MARFCPSRRFILDLGGGGGDGGWLVHFFLSKIVALVQVKGAGVPAAHPHPEILKVPPGTNPYISNVTQQ